MARETVLGADGTFDAVAALARALRLAITAPTDEQSGRAVELAERIAAGMTPEDVAAAKVAAAVNTGAE
jgi:predicted glycosyltransferase